MTRGGRGGGSRTGQLRIIGGQWRGRKLQFDAAPGLRPTTDRVRETLFNWLAPDIHDARCADLFAGSGALGLEALSRGAATCDFVDSNPGAIRRLQQHLQTLQAAARGHCHALTAQRFLEQAEGPWDIVFLDPPFGQGLAGPCIRLLATGSRLRAGALVYLELGKDERVDGLPPAWEPHREKFAGGVAYRLYRVTES